MLAGIRAEAEDALEGMGLRMLGSQEGEPGFAAVIRWPPTRTEPASAAFDARYGDGMVELVPCSSRCEE